jgi:subtilisin family serine protease
MQRLDFDNDERSAVVVEVHEDIARFMAATGFDVSPEWEVQATGNRSVTIQTAVPRHLDRIFQHLLPLDGQYSFSYTGKNAGGIVLDTAVLPNPDFADRLLPDGKDFVGDGLGISTDCGVGDTHATGVVSLMNGSRYGVAKEAAVVVGRVLGCDGRGKGSHIIKGLDWALSYAKAHPDRMWVVNLSLGGRGSSIGYDPYLKRLQGAGVLVVAAAGNEAIDVAGFAPANSRYVIAVGGTVTKTDRRYDRSNYGKGVAIYAPAENVQQAGGYDSTEWFGTGTSAAAPLVAGTLALLHEQFPAATGPQLKAKLLTNATQGVVKNTKTLPGPLLYAGPASRKARPS